MDKSIFERPAQWNAKRYEQEYNHALFSAMLLEEFIEFKEAKFTVDKLDALADLFFISVGALWKLKCKPYNYQWQELFIDKYDEYELIRVVNKIFNAEDHQRLNQIDVLITQLINTIFMEFTHLGCKEKDTELAIIIVCDSNDTKKLGKIHSAYKGDLKGINYVSPTRRLNLLAEVIENEKV